jgi:hypothetical protein
MEQHKDHAVTGSYQRLSIEVAIDFVIMYLVMYTMIATLDHFYVNVNNLYMTLMIVAPMTIIMQLSMHSMFPSPRLNVVIFVGAALVFIAGFAAMRNQTAVGNAQFLRSMIPAPLGCDPDVRASVHHRSRDCHAVPEHHRGAEERDRTNGSDARSILNGYRA